MNKPFCAEELTTLVEGVDVQFEYCEAEVACKLLCRKISCSEAGIGRWVAKNKQAHPLGLLEHYHI